MKIAGIVAEYNPFHNGHLYQIHQTQRFTQCEAIVVAMSGNFTQRGEATITDKFTRAKMALLNGADLVIELPLPFATASAERFASGAVGLFELSQIVTILSFGSECGSLTPLDEIATVLTKSPAQLDKLIQENLKKGLSFPLARQQALLQFITSTSSCYSNAVQIKEALTNPNNILGIEYIKALKRLHSSIKPLTIKREGAHYHDTTLNTPLASATAIRKQLIEGSCQYLNHMPPAAATLLDAFSVPNMNRLSAFLHFKLMFSQSDQLYSIWDIPKDLIRTFINQVKDMPSYEDLATRCTSKTYTKATVKRSLLRLLTEIKEEDFMAYPPYIRVLGCRKTRTDLLRQLSQRAQIPVITNLNKQYSYLSPIEKKWIDYEIRATKLYAYATSKPELAHSDFTEPFLVI